VIDRMFEMSQNRIFFHFGSAKLNLGVVVENVFSQADILARVTLMFDITNLLRYFNKY